MRFIRNSRYAQLPLIESMRLPAAGVTALPAHAPRIALYSPGMVGLGHMRRNLLIAQAIAGATRQAAILLIGEARQIGSSTLPTGVDCLTLPALRKDPHGRCEPRYLDIALPKLVALRAQAICGALEAFEPDVLIVDHLARGAQRELDVTLEYLRSHGRTRCVLGLRDVLEAPAIVQREWHGMATEAAIRDYFDAIWIYGDPLVYDQVHEYRFAPDIAQKVRYTGYLDQRQRLDLAANTSDQLLAALELPPGRLVLGLVGGGQDGEQLAQAFALASLPPNTNGLLVTGPYMPIEIRQRLHELAAFNPRLRIVDFLAEPTMLLGRADRVVAMGGYNTVAELLSFQKHALVVPRAAPRHEQQIRAERLQALGLLDVLLPGNVTPAAITAWLARDVAARPSAHERIDMRGLARLPKLLGELLAPRQAPQPVSHSREELLQRMVNQSAMPVC